MAAGRQPTALCVGQTHSSVPELLLEDTVLASQIVNHLELMAIHPTGQRHQEDLPTNGVDHPPSL